MREELSKPIIRKVKSIDITVDDHLGKTYTCAVEWGNGEGITFSLTDEKGNEKSIDLTWNEFHALKKAAKIIDKGE